MYKFKVGDKVLLDNNYELWNRERVVREVCKCASCIKDKWGDGPLIYFTNGDSRFAKYLKLVIPIGQQLEFDFMKDS